jgi:hypothetical protein
MPAPDGYWKFKVLGPGTSGFSEQPGIELLPAFPNPSKGITCIPVLANRTGSIEVTIEDFWEGTAVLFLKGMSGREKTDILSIQLLYRQVFMW